MQTLKAGALYFAVVFGAGFVLGFIRVLGVVPKFGPRTAELMEAPIMLLIIIYAARWVVRRLALPAKLMVRLGAGFIALGFLLAAEFAVVLLIRRLTIAEYLAGRDPLTGILYIALLLAFAVMPLFVARE